MATFLVPEVELVELVKKAAILPPIIKNHLTRLITLFLLIVAIFRDFKKIAKFNTIFEKKTIRTLKMFWVRVFFENVFPVFITSSTLHDSLLSSTACNSVSLSAGMPTKLKLKCSRELPMRRLKLIWGSPLSSLYTQRGS